MKNQIMDIVLAGLVRLLKFNLDITLVASVVLLGRRSFSAKIYLELISSLFVLFTVPVGSIPLSSYIR